jgi:hypothetical protein
MANPRHNGGDKNRPSRVHYHSSKQLVKNKMRKIARSFGRNKAAGLVAAEAWRKQYA